MVSLSSMAGAAGVFLYTAAALGFLGLAIVLLLASTTDPRVKPARRDQLARVPRWALSIALVHALLGLISVYRPVGFNFALADFQTVYAGLAVLIVSTAAGLLVVCVALLANAARSQC